MRDSAIEHYRQLVDSGDLGEDVCITWSTGLPLDELITLFGGNPQEAATRTYGEAIDESTAVIRSDDDDPPPVAVLGRLGTWSVCFEPYGGQGMRSLVLKALAKKGSALCVKWDVEFNTHLAYAVSGREIFNFDMLRIPRLPESVPVQIRRYIEELPFGQDPNNSIAAGLAFAEQISGQRLHPAWLRTPQTRFFIDNPLQVQRWWIPEELEDHPMLSEPRLAAILEDPTPDDLPDIAIMAGEILLQVTGLADLDDPAVDAALAKLGRRDSESEALPIRLKQVAASLRGRVNEGGRGSETTANLRACADAVDAISFAFDADEVIGTYNFVRRAYRIPRDFETRMRLYMLRDCVRHIRDQYYR